MKTIVCGPPHSGKSVFIANLIQYLPYDSYIRINANGDGEGTWSNNMDQTEVQRERIKSGNTPEDFKNWTNLIKAVSADIVLVDIGGRLQDDKAPLFEAADSFIILSSDSSVVDAWKTFGESHGCRCVAIIESSLDGEESVFSVSDNLVRGRICGLERGTYLSDSKVMKSIVEILVRLSGYRHVEVIDFYRVGQEIGCAKTWMTTDGIPVTNIRFPFSAAKPIKELMSSRTNPNFKFKIMNLKTNWVGAIVADTLCRDTVSDVTFYDEWTDSFISPKRLNLGSESNDDLDITVRETEDSVFLSIRCSGSQIDLHRFGEYILPEIDNNKTLFLSGRFPIWFTVSVLNSYASRRQYLLQPGNHYICVRAESDDLLGTIVDQTDK